MAFLDDKYAIISSLDVLAIQILFIIVIEQAVRIYIF